MKAIIMGGGEGQRLRPITNTMPKPMCPIAGRPAIEHIIKQVMLAGIKDIAITTMYRSDDIKNFIGDGSQFGDVQIKCVNEDSPLGTAGSVKNTGEFLDDDILVISGDCLCDFDLSEFIDFYYEKRASVAILLSQQLDPREYGVCVVNQNQEIVGFVEKPGWSDAVSDTVNTGIYILSKQCLDMIPINTKYDFAQDLFPKIMKNGIKIYGYESMGYWHDIGDIAAFLQSNFDVLQGMVKSVSVPPFKVGNALQKGIIIPPCYIAPNVVIEKNSVIGPFAVVGDNCIIKSGSQIKRSVLMDNVSVDKNCEITNSIICNNVSCDDNCTITRQSVIGAECHIESDSEFNNKKLSQNVCEAKKNNFADTFNGRSFFIDFDNADFLGECVRFANALRSVAKSIGLCCDESSGSLAIKGLLSSTLSLQNMKTWDLGVGYNGLCAFGAIYCGLDITVMVHSGRNGVHLTLFDKLGLHITRATERKLVGAIKYDDGAGISNEITTTTAFNAFKLIYQKELMKNCADFSNMFVSIHSDSNLLVEMLSKVLLMSGCSLQSGDNALNFNIDSVTNEIITTYGNKVIDHRQMDVLLAICEILQSKSEIAVAMSAPAIIDDIAKEKKCSVLRFSEVYASTDNRNARLLAHTRLYHIDPCFKVLFLLLTLKALNLSINELLSLLPEFYSFNIELDSDTHTLSHSIKELIDNVGYKNSIVGGLNLYTDNAQIRITPLSRNRVRLFSQALQMETAKSLCDDIAKKLGLS